MEPLWQYLIHPVVLTKAVIISIASSPSGKKRHPEWGKAILAQGPTSLFLHLNTGLPYLTKWLRIWVPNFSDSPSPQIEDENDTDDLMADAGSQWDDERLAPGTQSLETKNIPRPPSAPFPGHSLKLSQVWHRSLPSLTVARKPQACGKGFEGLNSFYRNSSRAGGTLLLHPFWGTQRAPFPWGTGRSAFGHGLREVHEKGNGWEHLGVVRRATVFKSLSFFYPSLLGNDTEL